MNRTQNVDCQKSFPSRLHIDRGHGTTAGWLGTWDNFPLHIDSVSWESPESFMQFVLSCNPYICEVSCCIVSWLSLNLCLEKTSIRISWALLNSSISWMPLVRLSRSAFSLVTNSSCYRTCSLRDSSYPQCASSSDNRWEWVCRWSSRMQLLRESTLHSCFMSSDLASASMWSPLPSRRDVAEFTGLENLKKGSLLPKTCWCLKGKSSLSENVFDPTFFFAWKQRDKSPCTYGILRWTGHQVFSFRVINLWSFRIFFSPL